MYPLESVYSLKAHQAWLQRERDGSMTDLRDFRQSWSEISQGPFWDVRDWDQLRSAVSFLTLMNKRQVLYFRGQTSDHAKCLPTLFRDECRLAGRLLKLNASNRWWYYSRIPKLAAVVLDVSKRIGTPRRYILEAVPAAAASILQHYELWPTHFVDITRSLPIAIAFAEGKRDKATAYVYTFAMPDLRGSITSDMDQHLTLSRLEAICPPAAKRPHHQDAYLVARFPEPVGSALPGDRSWDHWEAQSDLMARVVAKFRLFLRAGALPGAPAVDMEFLIPSHERDDFGRLLNDVVLPVVTSEIESAG